MEIINLEQGSKEWLELKNGIEGDINSGTLGSSEVSSILGISPYYPKNKGEVLELKAQYVLPEYKWTVPTVRINPAMMKGTRLEPQVRAWHSNHIGEEGHPMVFRHSDYPFLIASCDFVNLDGTRLGEYKVSRITYEEIKAGRVPPHYFAQVQHQLFVTGASVCDFVAYNEDIDDYAIIQIDADFNFQQHMLIECADFWASLVKRKQELLNGVESDGSDLVPLEIAQAARKFLRLNAEIEQIESLMNPLEEEKKRLITELEGALPEGAKSLTFCGIAVSRSERKGSVDYTQLLKQLGISDEEIEKYRKPSTNSVRVTVKK